jgi:hypothetical protein
LLRCLVGAKCSRTLSTLRFFASLRLALGQNCPFLDGHKLNTDAPKSRAALARVNRVFVAAEVFLFRPSCHKVFS